MTFGQLKKDIRDQIFPDGESSNLVKSHDKSFIDAIIDIQKWVACAQQNNTSLFPQCSTFYKCGMTVIDSAPRGIIRSVSVIDKNPISQSGSVTASKTDAIVTASDSFFDDTMIGSLIRFANGETFKITAFLSDVQVVVREISSTEENQLLILDGGPP